MVFSDRCPRCGLIVEYTEEATLLTCLCKHTFQVAEFISQRQKLAQQLEAGDAAKQALVETQAEKIKLQERLNDTLTALELIQSSQAYEESSLDNVLEILKEDRQTHDAMVGLLRAMRSEQGKGQDALSQLLCAVMQEQSSAEDKLNEVQRLATYILEAQLSGTAEERKMRREIQDEIEQLKLTEELKGQLAEDFYDWSRAVQEADLQRLKELQSSSRDLLTGQHKIAEQITHMDVAISEMNQAIAKGFDTLYQQRLEKLKELYHQATGFQVAREFDKAEEKYLTLLVEGGEDAKDAEVYWRLLLCHYGIEYQMEEDQLIPIILRPDLSPMESIGAYQNLKKSIKTEEQQSFYSARLDTIDFYLQRYREVKQNPEWQYDVFISVKQSFRKQPTNDSMEAMKLYERIVSKDPVLARKGLKVFCSTKTDLPSTEPYEPYIITALMSAKLLIVVGSCQEFMNSQWVKNEWSRFQYLQELDLKKKNQTDRKLLCYLIGGMTPHDIPREMKELQAIVADADTGDKLRDIIEKTFPNDSSSAKSTLSYDDPQLISQRMNAWLKIRRYQNIVNLYEKLENERPEVLLEVPSICICALCAQNQCATLEQIPATPDDLRSNRIFLFAYDNVNDDDLHNRLDALIREIPRASDMVNPPEQQTSQPRDQEEVASLVSKPEITEATFAPADQPEEHNYSTKLLSNSKCEITGYHGNGGDIEIPSVIDGIAVAAIGIEAFAHCEKITGVVVPTGVKRISKGAFAGCTQLKSVSIPKGVSTLCADTFCGCESLSKVELPSGVKSINARAFSGCKELVEINLPNSLTSIGEDAFHSCTKLKELRIPQNVSSIHRNTFSKCVDLPLIVVQGSAAHEFAKKEAYPHTVVKNSNDKLVMTGKAFVIERQDDKREDNPSTQWVPYRWQCTSCGYRSKAQKQPQKCHYCGKDRGQWRQIDTTKENALTTDETTNTGIQGENTRLHTKPSNSINRWECGICGYMGKDSTPPEKCPVCKVPPRWSEQLTRTEVEEPSDPPQVENQLQMKPETQEEHIDPQVSQYILGEKLSSGGTSSIYSVQNHPDLVAKVWPTESFEDNFYRHTMSDKIKAMLAMHFDPFVDDKYIAAWPKDIIADPESSNMILGYVMPKISETERVPLNWAMIQSKNVGVFVDDYHWHWSIKVAYNLSAAVDKLHRAGIIVGNMSPKSILVSKEGEVCFLGTDSFTIIAPPFVYNGEHGSSDLRPPELQGKDLYVGWSAPAAIQWKEKDKNKLYHEILAGSNLESDRFALAILIFQLLCHARHPFSVKMHDSVEQNILSGRCPYVTGSNLPTSAGVPDMNIFPPQIRKFFDRAFGYSADTAMQSATIYGRPTAREWCTELATLLTTPMVTCSIDRSHEYPAYCKNGCPWCKRRKLTDSDAVTFWKEHLKQMHPDAICPPQSPDTVAGALRALGMALDYKSIRVVGLIHVRHGILRGNTVLVITKDEMFINTNNRQCDSPSHIRFSRIDHAEVEQLQGARHRLRIILKNGEKVELWSPEHFDGDVIRFVVLATAINRFIKTFDLTC